MIAALLGGLAPKLVLALGTIVALGGVWLGIRRGGVRAQQMADARRTEEEVSRANQATAEVAGKSDAAVADDLRRNWTR